MVFHEDGGWVRATEAVWAWEKSCAAISGGIKGFITGVIVGAIGMIAALAWSVLG